MSIDIVDAAGVGVVDVLVDELVLVGEDVSEIVGETEKGFERVGGGVDFRYGAAPFGEVLSFGDDGADARCVAFGEDDDGVVPDDLGDGGFVVAQLSSKASLGG